MIMFAGPRPPYHQGVTRHGAPLPGGPGPPDQDLGALGGDLGWALGVVFRRYLQAANAVMADVPGGPRGYQVLAAAATGSSRTQLALAHRLGIDRTVMTYLLDDLERAGLVQRCADPTDRRVRRLVATPLGQDRLAELNRRLEQAEGHVLAALDAGDRALFRDLLCRLAGHAQDVDPVGGRCDAVEEIAGTGGLGDTGCG